MKRISSRSLGDRASSTPSPEGSAATSSSSAASRLPKAALYATQAKAVAGGGAMPDTPSVVVPARACSDGRQLHSSPTDPDSLASGAPEDPAGDRGNSRFSIVASSYTRYTA